MHDKHKRILAGLERLGGRAAIDDLSDATGISNRDLNNALRTIEPEFVETDGTKRRPNRKDDPKVLVLTGAGHEVGANYSVPMSDDQLAAMWQAIDNLRARVTELEDANARIVKRQQRQHNAIFELDK